MICFISNDFFMKKFLASVLAAGISLVSYAGEFSGKMNEGDVRKVCDAVAQWQIANFDSCPHHNLQWTNGALYRGMVEWGKVAGNADCLDFLMAVGDKNGWAMWDRVWHADDICVGQAFIELYRIHRRPEMLQPVMERAYYVANHPSTAPLTKNDEKGKHDRWSWCDALFMAPPVYAALYELTGEEVYVDYMDKEFRICTDSLYDHTADLYYRDCKRIPLREPNGSKQFWARGNGWVFAGIPLILENLPDNHPTRFYYLDIFRKMAKSIAACQDKNGAWHASLLDPVAYPVPENSASAFFCYGYAWGINNGILSEEDYGGVLEKGWKSVVSGVNPDGKLGYVQPIGAAPVSVSSESTDVYGVGALLLAGSEILKMK